MRKGWIVPVACTAVIGAVFAPGGHLGSGARSSAAASPLSAAADGVAVGTEVPEPISAGATTTTTQPPERRATLLFAGDVLTHMPVVRASERADGSYDMGALFSHVAPLVGAADIAMCHMEVPISADGSAVSGYPMFSAPTETAAAMAATGFDGCSTASNHSLDRGFAGLVSTLDALDRAGLAHVGTGRTADEAAAPAWYEAGGIKVAQLSYTYGTNGMPMPADAPWAVRLIDPASIIADAERARTDGAEFVVVSVHWGTEYREEPNEQQRSAADQITQSDAVDLVVGHHAHVPQPVERVNGKWVLFGLGNLVSNQSERCCSTASQDGVIATVELVARGNPGAAEVDTGDVTFTPVRVDRADGYKVVPVAEALAGLAPKGTLADEELRESLYRTTRVVARNPDPALVPSAHP